MFLKLCLLSLLLTMTGCAKNALLVGGPKAQATIDVTVTGGKVMAVGPFLYCRGDSCPSVKESLLLLQSTGEGSQ